MWTRRMRQRCWGLLTSYVIWETIVDMHSESHANRKEKKQRQSKAPTQQTTMRGICGCAISGAWGICPSVGIVSTDRSYWATEVHSP